MHTVLEQLFDLPAAERTPGARGDGAPRLGAAARRPSRSSAALFAEDAAAASSPRGWSPLGGWSRGYFDLEDPRRLTPAGREALVETTLESGLRLRGYIDRLDEAPDGRIRVVDYKTGAAPREAFEAKALFQMKFYALVIWRTHRHDPGAAAS